jgi:hypothetical protein
MRPRTKIACERFPCKDVDHGGFAVPSVEVDPGRFSIAMVSEASPQDPGDYYYARGSPLFEQTTVAAFQSAGIGVASMKDILGLGVYVTTAVKCAKKAYGVSPATIDACSRLLEQELALFPRLKALLLMGDVAIRAINLIAMRQGEARAVPAGPTYKVRQGRYAFRGIRVFPSYLQAGPSFFIEKSKRRMISEDIAAALSFVST